MLALNAAQKRRTERVKSHRVVPKKSKRRLSFESRRFVVTTPLSGAHEVSSRESLPRSAAVSSYASATKNVFVGRRKSDRLDALRKASLQYNLSVYFIPEVAFIPKAVFITTVGDSDASASCKFIQIIG